MAMFGWVSALYLAMSVQGPLATDRPVSPGCDDARVDYPSLASNRGQIAVVFPRRPCRGVQPGQAEIIVRHEQNWRRVAILPYDRGSNQNGRGFGRRSYRFASDTLQSADMWVEQGQLVVMRGRETLLRFPLRCVNPSES